jgi:hypothetical protein
MNIQGNVSIVGAITFGGSGTTTVIDTLSSSDPVTRTGANNTDDLYDLGTIGEFTVAVTNVVRTVSNKALTSNVATLTTTAAHTYAVGDVVVVTGVAAANAPLTSQGCDGNEGPAKRAIGRKSVVIQI